MCGIIGITADNLNEPIGKLIYNALIRLEYRGYDSVGISVINNDKIIVEKDKGSIKEVGSKLEFEKIMGNTAIGHSRWATHGKPSKENAHPHKSMNDDVVVVHNGIIENFNEMKEELIDIGYKFRSQTDTEVIPHFLSHQLEEGKTMMQAIQALVSRIKGTFAIVIAHTREPEKIYALKKDNPLVLGISEGANYCASDIPAFLPWTRDVVILHDNELAVITPENYKLYKLPNLDPFNRKPTKITWSPEAAQKKGYPHHMLKEIHEQPTILKTQIGTQEDVLNEIADKILNANKVVLIAAGTAYYASLNAYYTFPKYGSPIIVPTVAAEYDSIIPFIDDETLILAVSQSGETLDTIKAIKHAKSLNAKVVSVVNVVGSSITTLSDNVAYILSGPEIGVAATKTYSAQSLTIWRIARVIAERTGALDQNELNEFTRVINGVPKVAQKIIRQCEAYTRELSEWFAKKQSAFYLGRDISYVSALEGALKMKEISYIHAEAYSAGESKHGPIALVEDDYPVVFTMPMDKTRVKMMGSVQEMSARGARTIGIISEEDKEMKSLLDHYFEIPQGYSNYLTPITYEIPQQLLAYYTSVKRGYSPDRPRNLAKSVTVE